MFLLGENIPAAGGDRASAFVARFSATGKLEGIYELPLSQSVSFATLALQRYLDGHQPYMRYASSRLFRRRKALERRGC